jgi:ribosome-binding protein aMBF1 (putative translation factor)
MRKTKDALKILDQVIGDDPELRVLIEKETINLQIARMIYDARTAAGLSQKSLAELIQTKQPVIARLEDADYGGHSLSMLQRIAEALNQRVEIRFTPLRKEKSRKPYAA